MKGIAARSLVVRAALAGLLGALAVGEGVAQEHALPWLVAVNKSGGSVSIVDAVGGAEVAQVGTGHAAHEIATSGAVAYVADYGSDARPGNTVSVIDVASRRRTGVIELGEHTRPHGIGVARDGTVWVTAQGSGHVLQLDPVSRTVIRAVPTGRPETHMLALSPGLGRIYTANRVSGTVTVIDAIRGAVLATVVAGDGAEAIDVWDGGGRVYVGNRGEGTVMEIDMLTHTVLRTLRVGGAPIRIRVLPDTRQLLVSDVDGGRVLLVDIEDWRVARQLQVGDEPIGLLVAPDARSAFAAITAEDRIAVLDLDRWAVTRSIPAGDEPDGMAWSETGAP